MDQGAALIKENFGYSDALRSVLEGLDAEDWVQDLPDSSYRSDGWKAAPFVLYGRETQLTERFPIMSEVLKEFDCPVTMMVFYNLLPGAKVDPHRDTCAALELGSLRFHVPVRTNPEVEFVIDDVAVPMQEGQLWAMSTSHKHAVYNLGQSDRVHLMLQVEVNEWVRSLLPRRTHRYYLNAIGFGAVVLAKTARALFSPARLARYVQVLKKQLSNRRYRAREGVERGG